DHVVTLLCAGEAFEDLIFVGLERLPELGEEVKTDRFHATVGGGAVITAVQAARLGIRTHLVSALSDNACARLKKERVKVTNVRKKHEPHAITAALSTADDRAFVTYNGANAKLEDRLMKVFSRKPKAEGREHVHFCFYPHDCRYWTKRIERLRANDTTVSWDFGWNEPLSNDRGLIDLIDALDFVFINDAEARLYTGAATLAEAIPRWRERKAITIIKLGQEGAVWLRPDRDVYVAAPKVKVVDTTGAGDSFNAGFLAAWLRGKSPEQCLAAGNRIGAASTMTAGGI
ncbi:MAG TPA: carbohydrate kinase family protein, partial [Vicinamibacterales bacterium]